MHFNLFSGVLFGFAFVGLIGASAYPEAKKEAYVSALVFAAIGAVLLFV